ncbi:MAG: uracil-DNA glycosylase [Lentisphaeria bacterium]|nr:uracil-DNA glycosylase [Lentisphaeria bacterium]
MTAQKNIYDEIVQCLREIRRQSPAVTVSPEIMAEFMRDFPRQKTVLPPPEKIVSAPVVSVPSAAETAAGNSFSSESRYIPPAVSRPLQVNPVPGCGPSAEEVAKMDFETLASVVRGCEKCKLCRTRIQSVFEDGSRKADLLFLGEGPGADEDAQGVPFVGKAGQLLTKMIQAMQFDRKEVYICNVVKCRPPANRNPENDEVSACLPYMKRQIELVKPEVIVILGAVPLRALFPRIYGGIRNLRGKWMQYNEIPVMPTYHPAYLLREPSAKREAWADLQQVMAKFGKTAGRA